MAVADLMLLAADERCDLADLLDTLSPAHGTTRRSMRAPVLPSKRNTAGLRAGATDVDWHHGDGAEVHGPDEAILMALAGRADALDELEGPGTTTLASRVAP